MKIRLLVASLVISFVLTIENPQFYFSAFHLFFRLFFCKNTSYFKCVQFQIILVAVQIFKHYSLCKFDRYVNIGNFLRTIPVFGEFRKNLSQNLVFGIFFKNESFSGCETSYMKYEHPDQMCMY